MAKEETMMDVAERYLAELAQRCMVQVNVKETASGFKNYSLYNLMQDLCISKAKEENFMKVVDFRRERLAMESYMSNNPTRRVSVYLEPKVTNYPVACCEYRKIRSGFLDANDCREDFLPHMKAHLSTFKLLRVLDLQGFHDLDEPTKAIGDLIHLRYLSLSYSHFKKLPSSIGKLIYLQTLVLKIDNLLEVPNVIWKMERLKHLYIPGNFLTQDGTKLRLDELNDLETLVNFDTSICDVKDLDRLTNLRKLRTEIKDKLDNQPYIIKYISFT